MIHFIGFVLLLMFRSMLPNAFGLFVWISLFSIYAIVFICSISGDYITCKKGTYVNIDGKKIIINGEEIDLDEDKN